MSRSQKEPAHLDLSNHRRPWLGVESVQGWSPVTSANMHLVATSPPRNSAFFLLLLFKSVSVMGIDEFPVPHTLQDTCEQGNLIRNGVHWQPRAAWLNRSWKYYYLAQEESLFSHSIRFENCFNQHFLLPVRMTNNCHMKSPRVDKLPLCLNLPEFVWGSLRFSNII